MITPKIPEPLRQGGAYRGYVIGRLLTGEGYFITKGGHTIQCFVTTLREAQRIVDDLLGPFPPRSE